ncbi:MAG TPA: hypothetical protein VIJ07_04835 [Dermatophilaceae bacterium]|jgi:hypothetical protein
MAGFLVFLLYSVGVVVNARYYYRRRHGLLIVPGAQGTMTATALSMIWPVALFMHSYTTPELCTHPRHVRQRAANRQAAEELQHLLREEGH